MTRCLCAVTLVLSLFAGVSLADDLRATTEDGRKVLLKSNGTWTFTIKPKPSEADASGAFRKSEGAKALFKARGDKLLLWYDQAKWRQKKSEDSDKFNFEHRDGDVYGMMLAERIGMSLEGLRDLALRNAEKVAPDIKITAEETRVVNGKKVLCMKMEGTIEGVVFVYYGYYYAGKGGIVQLITFTSQNLFDEYQPEMAEFLNGLTIND